MPTSVRRLPRWRPLASGSCAPLLAKGVGLVSTSFRRVRTSFDRCQDGSARSARLESPIAGASLPMTGSFRRGSWIFRWASRSRSAAGPQRTWRAAVARGARALRRQYPTPGWALARSTWVLPRTNANACSHTLTHPSARAQVATQTTRSIGTVDLVQGAAVEAHSPSPSPALRRALP